MSRSHGTLVWGSDSELLRYEKAKADGSLVAWVSGTVTVKDRAGTAYVTAAEATPTSDSKQLTWRPEYGSGADQIPSPPDGIGLLLRVQWHGVSVDGHHYALEAELIVLPQL